MEYFCHLAKARAIRLSWKVKIMKMHKDTDKPSNVNLEECYSIFKY